MQKNTCCANFEISPESKRMNLKIGHLAHFLTLNKNTPTKDSDPFKFPSNFHECSTSKQKNAAEKERQPSTS